MLSLNVGPFSFPVAPLYLLMAIGLAMALGFVLGRRRKVSVGNVLTDMALVGLLAARVGFVLMWFAVYREDWITVFHIRDGGFAFWPGMAAAIAFGAWKTRGDAVRREVLAMAVLAGTIGWFVAGGARAPATPASASMPDTQLVTLGGQPVTLAGIASGKPAVVAVWTSWCPYCRRELPVLAAAQRKQPDLEFIFVNAGEDTATIARYLGSQQMGLRNVVRDPTSALGQAVGSSALPTNLFYDRDGKLVDVHLGALSAATLADKVARLRAAP